ncbi:Mediator of RNA polymerase II transcription subunit 20a [Sarracenia purpurea var. burkii]
MPIKWYRRIAPSNSQLLVSRFIKTVLHWQPNAGTTVNSQILNEVSQCVESINGVKEGRWKATLTFYKPILREQASTAEFPREFLGILLPEQPNKYYFVIRGQKIVLEAEQTIQTIMEKLQSYKTRVALNFEGFQYQLGDFQLRVGKVVPMQSESLRGIVMEMEYLPISSLDKSRQIMEEFLDIWQEALSKRSLPGHFMHIEPNFTEFGLSDNYTSQHTAVQYATIMAQLIATAQAVQAVRN